MKLTRAQILKKYDLRPKNLDVLLGSGLIADKFESSHGRLTLDVSPESANVFESARNSIYSFGYGTVQNGKSRGVHAMPFHRFLVLRFLTTPLDEIYDEIFQLELLHQKTKFPMTALKSIHKRFLSRIPKILKKTVENMAPPKTKKQKEAYKTFLRVMQLKRFYEEPELVEQLLFFMRMKGQMEMYLSTQSSHDEISQILSAQLGRTVTPLGVWCYRILFYSIHEITADDLEFYLHIIRPQERRMKKQAIPKTIRQLAVALGIAEVSGTRDVLEEIKSHAQKEFFDQRKIKTSEARQAQKFALDQFMKADEYIEKHGGNLVDFSKIFGKFVIEKAPSNVISIEDIKGGKRETGTE